MSSQDAGRYSVIPSRALFDRRLGDAALRVLAILGCYSDKEGWSWPSLTTLAKDTGVSRQAISKQIGVLIDLSYIKSEERHRADGGQTSNRYLVIADPPQPQVAPPQPLEVAPPATSGGCTKNYPIEQPTKETLLPPDGDAPEIISAPDSPVDLDEPPPPTKPKPTPAERAAIWDAYVEGTGLDPLTKHEKSNLGAIVKETLAAGFTPKQVLAACDEYRREWVDKRQITMTHRGVYSNITVLLRDRHARKQRIKERGQIVIV